MDLVGAKRTNWSAGGPNGTNVLIEVPNGVLKQQDALRLTTADESMLRGLTKNLQHVTVLGGYGLNIAGDTPNGPIELWFNNPTWVPGTMVYSVNQEGSLTWVTSEVLSSGWLRFAVTPDDLAQGGNFVMVLPNVVNTLKVNEGLLEWNGIVQDMPTAKSKGGTYAALFYVMKALKGDGVNSHWNGKAWTISTDTPVNVTATTEKPQPGDVPVVLNGTTVGYLAALVAHDRWTNRPTTYVSIDELNTIVKSVFGTSANWVYGK